MKILAKLTFVDEKLKMNISWFVVATLAVAAAHQQFEQECGGYKNHGSMAEEPNNRWWM